ncbi:MAG: hypothetical protein HY936_02490 [Nitrosomonadales bacterium]|nr:hypothetical protein [Nitrosomonadales bacterium]
MNKLIAVLVMLALASSVYAGNNDTPEALAELFIAAVNAKSKEKQKATMEPPTINMNSWRQLNSSIRRETWPL